MNFFLFLLLLPALLSGYTSKPIAINIIHWDNGVGLTSDYVILKRELTNLGHKVNRVNLKVNDTIDTIPKADVNIFIEHAFETLFKFAKLNYFIPNPEWCIAQEKTIKKFDLILCRTKEVERIFQPINPNTYFLGFTSIDRFKGDIPKNFSHYFHLQGQSKTKGTESIIKLWSKKPGFPQLWLLSFHGNNPGLPNVKLIRDFISEHELCQWLNKCGVHLCTSETEGFGHSLSEAMSTGAVVITTNAPPMNEFIKDKRCLVKVEKSERKNLATAYHIDPSHLATVVENLKKLTPEELQKMGRENRKSYIENKKDFIDRLTILFAPGTT